MMKLLDMLIEAEDQEASAGRIYGVVVGVVTNNEDPDNLGRVKVRFPWLSDDNEGYWARLATPMAGADRGIYFLPEVQDEVLVIFEQGDVRFPFIIGALWNGKDKPPAPKQGSGNNIRLIKSRSGHIIRLDDGDGAEKIEIIDRSKKNRITLDTKENTIAITADKDIRLSAVQGTISLEANNIQCHSTAKSKMTSDAGMEVEAKTTLNLKGQMINLN
jgi:uncharacterized protein involved in type VI secretion and phage assembly